MVRRLGLGALLAAVLLGALAGPAAACDEAKRSAASGPHNARAPLIVGDSTMIFAAPYLGHRGFEADAHSCRQFSQGVAMLAARRRAGTLAHFAVLALGANGPVSEPMIEGALRAVGGTRILGLVTPRNLAVTRAAMHAAARRHPGRVLLIDWAAFSAGHDAWFGDDGLHVNFTGARAYAAFIARHSRPEMPPVRALRMPRSSRRSARCGSVRRQGRAFRVLVARGARRVACARARQIARTPPLRRIPGWRAYDWRDVGRGWWSAVYARLDHRILIGTIRMRRARAAAARVVLRLSAPAERAAGLRLPLAVSGAPPGARVVVERRAGSAWRPVSALFAGRHGRARASLRTRPQPARHLRYRAALADGTAVSPAARVTLRYVTLRAVGDINLGDGPGDVMAARGPRWPWGDVAPLLRGADIAFGNLECSVSRRGAPVPKEFNFRGNPAYLSTVADFAGLDLVNLANNHVGDYGPAATADTIRDVRRAGMLAFGAGLNVRDAARARIVHRLGLSVAFVGFSDILPTEFAAGPHSPGTRWATPANIAHDIRAARRRADLVIASFHWGVERDPHSTARQRAFAALALRSGATAVIAAHPHVLQPVVRAGHHLVAYSLGNFVWSAGSGPTARTGILTVRLSPRGVEGSSLRHATIVGSRPRLRRTSH